MPTTTESKEPSQVERNLISTISTENNLYGNLKDVEALEQLEEESAKRLDKKERCISKIKILWAFISFWISLADVTVIIYLSYLHFSHSSDLMAWLMLLPILFNFIGIFTFLSDDDERHEMESLGCRRYKNFMFYPVFGPTFSALKLFAYSLQQKDAEKFERLESLLTRMKQYESFFRAAPEAFIQIAFRIITYSSTENFHAEYHWTSLCILLCGFALAESNMYAPALSYYHMFKRIKTKDAWRIDHIGIRWRIALFFYTYISIGSRIFADAILKATACFYFHDYSFGEVIIVVFIVQFIVRAKVYGIYNKYLGSKKDKLKIEDEGVYGAFTYSWRTLFMSFDFHSPHKAVFLGFYIENVLLIIGSYIVMYTWVDGVDLNDKYIYHIYSGLSVGLAFIAIFLKFFLWRRWQRQKLKKENSNRIAPP